MSENSVEEKVDNVLDQVNQLWEVIFRAFLVGCFLRLVYAFVFGG